MDNGQPKGSAENPYFTAGVGDFSPEINDDLENSLDEKEWQKALEISTPVGLPPIEKPQEPEQKEAVEDFAETPHELGKITSIDPISFNQPIDPQEPTSEKPRKYNPTSIRTTGDHLEKSTIPEIDNVINELNQTGDLNNFYNEIRGTDDKPGMMETNLDNSFNRKLGNRGGEN